MPLFAQRFERAAGGGLLRLLFGAPCTAADLAAVEQHGHGERLVVIRTALGADGIRERLSGADVNSYLGTTGGAQITAKLAEYREADQASDGLLSSARDCIDREIAYWERRLEEADTKHGGGSSFGGGGSGSFGGGSGGGGSR